MLETIIIGAGMAGARCAQLLAAHKPVLVEKSRGAGGRAATRYAEIAGDTVRIDHGAQYATAHTADFAEQLARWQRQGIATVWTRGFHRWRDGALEAAESVGHPRLIAAQGMNHLVKACLGDSHVHYGCKVTRLEPLSQGWRVHAEDGSSLSSQRVVLSIPAPQLRQLLEASGLAHTINDALAEVTMQACYALLLTLHQAPPWQGVFCEHPILSWLAHDSSKRPQATMPVVVAHAQRAYSQQQLESDPNTVREAMLAGLEQIDSSLSPTGWHSLHRWRYAQASHSYPTRHIVLGRGLFACGDWCGGTTLEDAYLSGSSLARHILATS